ncbi:MAG: 4Fe-4S binding protein [Desulfobacteraceae bacterium]|nr:4Fe-4S binding protein [Desulfobacteraceae bacterium]
MDKDGQRAGKCEAERTGRYGREGPDFDEETAVKEGKRCLGNHSCDSCDLCRYLCPDLCITRNEKTGLIEIDYNFCKGCGICAFVCPKGAIEMFIEGGEPAL